MGKLSCVTLYNLWIHYCWVQPAIGVMEVIWHSSHLASASHLASNCNKSTPSCVCLELYCTIHQTWIFSALTQSHLGKWRSELKHLIKERAKKLEEINQSIRVIKVSPLYKW